MKKVLLLLIVAGMTLQSCATIIAPVNHTKPVHTELDSYDVYLNGVFVGSDLEFIDVNNKDIVTIKKDGYKDKTTLIKGKFNGWVVGNVVLGGVIGVVVDAVSDNLINLKNIFIDGNLKIDETYMPTETIIEVKQNKVVEIHIGMEIVNFKNNYPLAKLHSLERGKAVYMLGDKLVYFENDQLVKIGASGTETLTYKKN